MFKIGVFAIIFDQEKPILKTQTGLSSIELFNLK